MHLFFVCEGARQAVIPIPRFPSSASKSANVRMEAACRRCVLVKARARASHDELGSRLQ
jgi:hypothetical protein